MLFEIPFEKGLASFPVPLQSTFLPLMTDTHFIATTNLERSISLYTLYDWATLEFTIQRIPNSHKIVRRVQRMMIAYATKVSQDSLGGIQFPEQLLEYASIESTAVAIAFDHKLEIWNPIILKKYFKVPYSIDRNKIMEIRKFVDKSSNGLFSKFLCADVQAMLDK